MNILVISLLIICILLLIGGILMISFYRQAEKNNQEEAARRMAELSSRLEQREKELNEISTQREKFLIDQMRLQFKALSEESFRLQSQDFRQLNGEQINSLLQPLKERLEEFNRACTDAYVKENAARQSLSDHIDRLVEINQTIGEDAKNLTSALRNNSQMQGRWGEVILETLLERGGLKEGINYKSQLTRDDEMGLLRDETTHRMLRPDIVVFLPGEKCLIIDSKVSLNAYVDYCSCSDEKDKAEYGRRHVESVKRHIKELSDKHYPRAVRNSVDQVIMFVPNEGAFLAALNLDNSLWDYAFERKVVIVSPTHLFSVIHLINHLWQLETRNRNVDEVAKLGGLIYDSVASLMKEFSSIEKNLRQAQDSWSNCQSIITKGPRSLTRRTERLREMGVPIKRRLSPEHLEPKDTECQND